MKLPHFVSSGGVGDALIAGVKIKNAFGDDVSWNHYEKHECHQYALTDLVEAFGFKEARFISHEKPYFAACEAVNREKVMPAIDQYSPAGGYVSSVCRTMEAPFLPSPICRRKTSFTIPIEAICIQALAGRPHDDTRRIVGMQIVRSINSLFPGRHIVIVGPERNDLFNEHEIHGLINLTGRTPSVVDALSIIDLCAGFVGHDGVMAYYAMMRRKPTIVSYHMPMLAEHYWNDTWAPRTQVVRGDNNMRVGCKELDQFSKMVFRCTK